MKNFVQNGNFVEFTAPAAIISGQLVKIGDLFGVAVTDIASGGRGNLALSGVFRIPKLTAAAGDATVEGGPVYFSAANASVSGASATGPLCGYATEVAAQATTTVKVMLLG